ncbi:MAG: MFS transporter [Chloroflexi bacterium]|nr:MFS transporter [Chloroflexota bacterium]
MRRDAIRQLTALTRDQRYIFISGLLWGFGVMLFFYIQPLYIASLGASPEQIGLVLGVSGLAVGIVYVPIGQWADRRGRKPVIVAGWGLGTLATLAMSFAPDWRWLIPAMAAYLFSNFAVPALNGYVAASDTSSNPSRTFAILASGSSIGSIVSPAIGGWIGESFGLRDVYFFATICFALSTLAMTQLSDQPIAPHAPTDSPGALLSNRAFLWQIVFTLLLFFAIDLGQVMTPKFLGDVRGLSVGEIGRLGTVGSLGIVLFTLVYGHMPVERRRPLMLAQAAAMGAMILIWRSPSLFFIALAYFIHGSNRVMRPLITGRLARSLNRATVSIGYGFFQTAMQIGLSISPYVAGLLYTRHPSWPLMAGIVAVAATIGLTFTLPAGAAARASAMSHQEI